jgi:hypothetical protein
MNQLNTILNKKEDNYMKKETLFLLGIVGLGLYLYYRNKKSIIPANNTPVLTNSDVPVNDTGVPKVQTLDARGQAIDDNSYRAYFSLSGYKKLGNIPNTI